MGAFQSGFSMGQQAWQNAQSAKERDLERERQAKQDAWQEEQRARERQGWQEADRTKADIKDATAERQTVQGTETTGGGTRMFSATPENAASMAALMANEAELTGAAPVQMPTTAVTGNMARGHQIGATADGMNKPEAVNQRVVGALMKNGQIERAATMQNTALDQQLKNLNIDAATFKLVNDKFNMKVGERLSGPDWVKGVEGILAETKLGGLDGITPTARTTKDGNSIEFFYEKDGKQVVLATLPAGEKGRLEALKAFSRFTPDVQIGWLYEQEKNAQAQANDDREYKLNRDKFNADQKYRDQTLALRSAGGGGGGGGGGGSGGGQAATAGGPSVGLKERRDMLGDYGKLLPQPDGLDPETSQKTQLANAQALEQADAIFSMNAGVGSVLTAPQIMSAQRLSQNPANVKLLRDNETGQMYQTVIVSGKPVVVGVAQQKPQQEAAPQPAQPQAQTNKPWPMTAQLQKKPQAVQPAGRNEFLQMQDAMRMGYEAVGRGNAMFGNGEVLYINKKTGERKYASQLFSK